MNKSLISCFFLCLAFSTTVYAADSCEQTVVANQANLAKVLDFNGHAACLIELIAASPQYNASVSKVDPAIVRSVLKDLTQMGSSVGSGGTTNLVSKGLAANVLSAASEYGALSQSTHNQTVTISGAVAGIPSALKNHGAIADCAGNLLLGPCVNEKWIRVLNRFTYSVAFDTSQNSQGLTGTTTGQSQGTGQPVTFTANSHQIDQIVGKAILVPGNPVTPAAFIEKVKADLDSKQGVPKAAKAADAARQPFVEWEEKHRALFEAWQGAAIQHLKADGAGIKAAWKNNLADLGCSLVYVLGGPEGSGCGLSELNSYISANPVNDKNPKLFTQTQTFAASFSAWVSTQYSFAESLRAKPVLTFEYDENRPASQPSNSVFRLVYSQSVKKWTLTANGAASIYDSAISDSIPGGSRLRDFQLAGEADYDLSSKFLGSGTSAGIAYYYQDQTSPAILNVTPGNPVSGVTFIGLPADATQVFAKKGVINIAQAKMTIGSSQYGFSFPVALSWSNRTELISKPEWRAQIGIAYNFDSLFSSNSTQ